mmetsp:Transcript_25285/g.72801  ORF Transcript_25285/g.72801 Transcript_25285/m.72801 type:complete len:284 (-) Transcript_25285:920-1771(-)
MASHCSLSRHATLSCSAPSQKNSMVDRMGAGCATAAAVPSSSVLLLLASRFLPSHSLASSRQFALMLGLAGLPPPFLFLRLPAWFSFTSPEFWETPFVSELCLPPPAPPFLLLSAASFAPLFLSPPEPPFLPASVLPLTASIFFLALASLPVFLALSPFFVPPAASCTPLFFCPCFLLPPDAFAAFWLLPSPAAPLLSPPFLLLLPSAAALLLSPPFFLLLPSVPAPPLSPPVFLLLSSAAALLLSPPFFLPPAPPPLFSPPPSLSFFLPLLCCSPVFSSVCD